MITCPPSRRGERPGRSLSAAPRPTPAGETPSRRTVLVATHHPAARLVATVAVAARAARDRADGRRALAADRAADARAERRAAQDRAGGPRAALKVAPRRATVEGVEARAARADGRALLAADQRADARAARDDGRRPRLPPELRALPPSLPEHLG